MMIHVLGSKSPGSEISSERKDLCLSHSCCTLEKRWSLSPLRICWLMAVCPWLLCVQGIFCWLLSWLSSSTLGNNSVGRWWPVHKLGKQSLALKAALQRHRHVLRHYLVPHGETKLGEVLAFLRSLNPTLQI